MSETTVTAIIVAIISGMSVAIPTIIATLSSNKAHDCVIDEKMKNVEEQVKGIDIKIDKYASSTEEIRERLIIVEQSAKSAHHRLDDIANQLKIKERR
jgi:outer membrane murein-binding lipoprotein Lpp